MVLKQASSRAYWMSVDFKGAHYTNLRGSELLSPLAVSDGDDALRDADQLIPCITAMIDDFLIGMKDAVGEPVFPHELPDIFDGIEFRAFGRQWNDADIVGYDERRGHMPPGLIHEHDRMGSGLHGSSNFSEMQVHCVSIAEGQDKTCALA
jgi:hypothetical protein